jgi:hypothetical protein
MFRKIILIFVLTNILILSVISQKQQWYGSFYNICDDREYFSQWATSQTILGARINVGREFDVDTSNQIFVGLNYLIEYGDNPFSWKPVPDLYYKFEIENFRMFFGSFPRYGVLNYPLVLLTDTLLYYRPNIQGGLFELNGEWGYQNVWCDWVSRQSMTEHEAFLAGTSGHYGLGLFYAENYLYMFHHAGNMSLADSATNHVRDNGGGAVYFGTDLKSFTNFDKLTFDVGYVANYDRTRPDPYRVNKGFQTRVSALYKRLGTDISYYKGDKITLGYGEPFYECGNYGRLDLFFAPVKSKRIESRIGWSFHLIEGETLAHSFQVYFRVYFLGEKNK